MQVADARKAARENASLDTLHRETNRLLRQALIEQQVVTRAGEFESRAYVRPLAGGQPAPTIDSLLSFHDHAAQAGDDAAQELARCQLEGLRPQLPSAEDQHRVDLACDRPDRVNPTLVARYLEALQEAAPRPWTASSPRPSRRATPTPVAPRSRWHETFPRVPTSPGRARCSMG